MLDLEFHPESNLHWMSIQRVKKNSSKNALNVIVVLAPQGHLAKRLVTSKKMILMRSFSSLHEKKKKMLKYPAPKRSLSVLLTDKEADLSIKPSFNVEDQV